MHEALQDDELDGESPGDVADAISALTDVYDALSAQLRGPGEGLDDE